MGFRFITLKLNLQAKQEQFRNQEILHSTSIDHLPAPIPIRPLPITYSVFCNPPLPTSLHIYPVCLVFYFSCPLPWPPLAAIDRC
jgi:hypothetical protein